MNIPLSQWSSHNTILVGDGAMGSELISRGLTLETPCENWNLESPEKVISIHAAYVEAGSHFILTNTFGGNPFRLREYELHNRLDEINRVAVELAREAAQGRAWVLGDIGPSGQYLAPHGAALARELADGFERQVRALAEAGVDAFLIETMMDLEEMKVAIEATRRVRDDLPIFATMSFKKRGVDFVTLNGVNATEAARVMEGLGAAAIGANCMYGIEEYPALIRDIRDGCSTPIIAQPNAGQPRVENGRAVYPATPITMIDRKSVV